MLRRSKANIAIYSLFAAIKTPRVRPPAATAAAPLAGQQLQHVFDPVGGRSAEPRLRGGGPGPLC